MKIAIVNGTNSKIVGRKLILDSGVEVTEQLFNDQIINKLVSTFNGDKYVNPKVFDVKKFERTVSIKSLINKIKDWKPDLVLMFYFHKNKLDHSGIKIFHKDSDVEKKLSNKILKSTSFMGYREESIKSIVNLDPKSDQFKLVNLFECDVLLFDNSFLHNKSIYKKELLNLKKFISNVCSSIFEIRIGKMEDLIQN